MKVSLETPIPVFTPTDLRITLESLREKEVLVNALEHYRHRHAKPSELSAIMPILQALGA